MRMIIYLKKKICFAVEMWDYLILRDENSDSADCGCEWSEVIWVWTLFYHMMAAVSQFYSTNSNGPQVLRYLLFS